MNRDERKPFQLYLTIRIQDNQHGGCISLNQDLQIAARDFLEMARILGEFQKLADRFKQSPS